MRKDRPNPCSEFGERPVPFSELRTLAGLEFRGRTGLNTGLAVSEFRERKGLFSELRTVVGSKFRERTVPNLGSSVSEFGERTGLNPGSAGSEFGLTLTITLTQVFLRTLNLLNKRTGQFLSPNFEPAEPGFSLFLSPDPNSKPGFDHALSPNSEPAQ